MSNSAYEEYDFPTMGENIYSSRKAVNWPLTGKNNTGRERCVDW